MAPASPPSSPNPRGWARCLDNVADVLRRGAWYPIVDESDDDKVILEVRKKPVRVSRVDVTVRDTPPDHWSVVVRIGGRLDEPLALEALDEGRGGGTRHAQLARDVARPGPVRPAQVHRRHHGVGSLRQPEALIGAIAGAFDGLLSRDDGVGEL